MNKITERKILEDINAMASDINAIRIQKFRDLCSLFDLPSNEVEHIIKNDEIPEKVYMGEKLFDMTLRQINDVFDEEIDLSEKEIEILGFPVYKVPTLENNQIVFPQKI
jgi:hypothetical protein